jgi:glycosyltransferase involved in cell wall biosynthesis
MRVLFVYKLLTMGGVETVLRARLEGLPRHGIDAHAWFLFDGPGRIIFEDLPSKVHVGSTGLFRDYITQKSFDLISSIDTEEIFPLLRRFREPPKLVLEVHTPYVENLEYLKLLADLPISAYFVPSEYQSGILRKRVGDDAEIRVIPNPLGENFEKRIDDFKPRPPNPVIAWVGRLDDLKNWSEFIEIARLVKQEDPAVEFWIVGRSGGEDISQDLFHRARKAEVLDHLRWYRGLPYENMPRLLDAVRSSGGIVVSTSRGDSFGMTVAEAMARACAVLVPSKGPFGEFVQDGQHGFMYELGQIKEAASKIARLMKEKELRSQFGTAARSDILKRHAIRPSIGRLAAVLSTIVDEEE